MEPCYINVKDLVECSSVEDATTLLGIRVTLSLLCVLSVFPHSLLTNLQFI